MRPVVLMFAVVACAGPHEHHHGQRPPDSPDAGSPAVLPMCAGQINVTVADDHVPFMEPRAAVTQPDDKLVVVGQTDDPPSRFVVVRYLADGTLDPSFSADGVAVPALGNDTGAGARAVAVQADGKLLVAGVVDGKAAVARLTASGDLDTTFSGGFLSLGTGTPIGVGVSSTGITVAADGGNAHAILYRVGSSGAPDPTFGTNGVVTDVIDTQSGAGETVSAFFLDPKGRSLLVTSPNDAGGPTVVRVNPDGSRDTTFGASSGAAWPPIAVQGVGGITAQASGRLLLAMNVPTAVFALLDHGALDSGAADSSYGAGGLTWLPDGLIAQSMVMDTTGAVTVTGDSGGSVVASHLTANGQYDQCWISTGTVGTSHAAAIDSQGHVTIIASAPVDSMRTRLVLGRL